MTTEIDLAGVTTREDFHERVRQALPLPAWYGNNLDAFFDVLTERPELTVCLSHTEQLPPWYLAALHRMSRDCGGQLTFAPAREEPRNGGRSE